VALARLSQAGARSDTERGVRRISVVAFASWCLLVALQLGWFPFARYAWAFKLWGYFPGWVGVTLGAAGLLLCFGSVRSAILSGAARMGLAAARLPRVPALLAALLGLALVAWLLWLLRERYIAGDSILLMYAIRGGWLFAFQEPGASFLIRQAVAVADWARFGAYNGVSALSCV
jgi:hypothetical protein